MTEQCTCDNLNQFNRFFLKKLKEKIILKRLGKSSGRQLIVCPYFKLNGYNLYMVRASEKGEEGDCYAIFFSFLIIHIVVPLYKRKFCDGHIILVF